MKKNYEEYNSEQYYGAWSFAGILITKGKEFKEFVVFRDSCDVIASKLKKLEESKEVEEIKSLNNKYKNIVWELPLHNSSHLFPNPAGEYLRKNEEKLLIKEKIIKGREEYIERLLVISIILLKENYKKKITKDKIIISIGSSLDTLTKLFNEVVMRVKEIVAYYLPGYYESFSSNELFISSLGDLLTSILTDEEGNEKYQDILKDYTLVADFSQRDIKTLLSLVSLAKSINDERERVERYVFNEIKKIMPNTFELLGGEIAFKLLQDAGSLEALAKFPSSTIQVLGAEKALFLHLRGRGKSPKHGIIFLTDYIQRVSKRNRGKVARTLSLKISLAVKLDYFSKEYRDGSKGREMRKEMLNFINKLEHN